MSDIDLGNHQDCFVNLPSGKRAIAVNNADGPFDVYVQDQTTQIFQYFMIIEQKTDITLTMPIEINNEIINVSAGHGFIIGSIMVVSEGDKFEQKIVTSVTVNAIGVDIPMAKSFTIDAKIVRGNRELNVDGSETPIDFFAKIYGAGAIIPIDTIYAKITMIHAAAGDLTKFGGITELDKGLYMRKSNGEKTNLGNYKRNQDFEDFGWKVSFDDRAGGGGEYSTIAVMDVKKIFGVASRIFPILGDSISGSIRDNLTGFISLRFMLYGQYTQGEEI